jgi:hypothetical protein
MTVQVHLSAGIEYKKKEVKMDIEISEEKIDRLNEIFGTISNINKIVKVAKEDMATEFEIKEKNRWENPIETETYDIEQAIERMRKNTIRFTVAKICSKPNFKINNEEVVEYINGKLGEKGFDAREIRDYIKREYLDNADELALKEINENATKLLPVILVESPPYPPYGTKKIELKDILVGGNRKKEPCMLKLHAYLGWGNYFVDMNSFCEEVAAFEKLIDITLAETPPSEAHGDVINTIYWNARYNHSAESDQEREKILLERYYTYRSEWIEWVKLYKNSRFDVKFRKAEDALKVATALIEAKPPSIY